MMMRKRMDEIGLDGNEEGKLISKSPLEEAAQC
jgi:hypothetical protein